MSKLLITYKQGMLDHLRSALRAFDPMHGPLKRLMGNKLEVETCLKAHEMQWTMVTSVIEIDNTIQVQASQANSTPGHMQPNAPNIGNQMVLSLMTIMVRMARCDSRTMIVINDGGTLISNISVALSPKKTRLEFWQDPNHSIDVGALRIGLIMPCFTCPGIIIAPPVFLIPSSSPRILTQMTVSSTMIILE